MLPSKEVTETATSIKMINSLLSHQLTYFEEPIEHLGPTC